MWRMEHAFYLWYFQLLLLLFFFIASNEKQYKLSSAVQTLNWKKQLASESVDAWTVTSYIFFLFEMKWPLTNNWSHNVCFVWWSKCIESIHSEIKKKNTCTFCTCMHCVLWLKREYKKQTHNLCMWRLYNLKIDRDELINY